MERRLPSPLTVSFDYSGDIADGDRMKIGADRTVSRVTDPYDIYVGRVYGVEAGIGRCTLVVPYVWNRDDVVAGEASMGPGYYVLGPDNKAFPYTQAKPARHDGTATGPKTVVVDTSDVIKLKIEGGSSQTITITAGVGLTFAAIAAEVNATLTDMHLEVDAAGHLNIVADDIFRSVEVEAVTHDAYTLLGWTAAVYKPTTPSHDPSCIKGVIVKGATLAGDLLEVLEL